MIITSSLRFLYIFLGSGLLCGVRKPSKINDKIDGSVLCAGFSSQLNAINANPAEIHLGSQLGISFVFPFKISRAGKIAAKV